MSARNAPALTNNKPTYRGETSPMSVTCGSQQQGAVSPITCRQPITEAIDSLGHATDSLSDRFSILVQRLSPIMPPVGPAEPSDADNSPRCQESELAERLRVYEARIRSVERWIVDILGRIEV
jgi:hypothetical protein